MVSVSLDWYAQRPMSNVLVDFRNAWRESLVLVIIAMVANVLATVYEKKKCESISFVETPAVLELLLFKKKKKL